jgi:hypothetical protein
MKKSITYEAVETSGTRMISTYYWNGFEFITNCKVKFPEEAIAVQYEKAKAALPGMPAMYPEEYNFGIK